MADSRFEKIRKGLEIAFGTDSPRQGSNSVNQNRFDRSGFGMVKGVDGLTSRATDYGSGDPMAIYRTGASKPIPASKAMAANTGWVYCATDAIAAEMAGMEFKVFQLQADGTPEELSEHDLLDFLDGVNDFQTGAEFKHMLSTHLELTGNFYALLVGEDGDPVGSFDEQPASMFTLNPANIKIIFDKTFYPWTIRGYEFRIEGKKYTYQPCQVLHIKYPDPSDPYEGIGTVQSIPAWIDLHNYALEMNRQYFIRGIQFGQMVESDSTDDASIERLKSSLEAGHQGVENSYNTVVAPKGVKFLPGGKAKDADYTSLFDLTRDMILAGFRVGKTILGTAESDTNRATAETADYVFAKRTIKPKMTMIIACLNEFLTPRFGDDIYIGFLDPTPEDKNFRITEMQAVMASQPVMSLNETREHYQGLGPVEGGDTVMVGTTFTEVGEPTNNDHPGADNVEGKSKSVRKLPRKSKRIAVTRHAKNAKFRKSLAETMAERITEKVATIKAKRFSELTHEEYGIYWQKFIDRTTEYEEQLATAMVKVNAAQKVEVLANLAKLLGKKSRKTAVPALFDAKKWTGIVADISTPILTSLAQSESTAAGAMFGKPGIDVATNPEAAKALDEAIQLMAKSYSQTTLDQLKAKVAEGLAQNAGYDATAELVSEVYAFADETRSLAVARTETNRVANEATKSTWKSIGVQTIKFYTADDGDVCPFCAEMNGKIISVDQNFFDKGDTLTLSSGQSMTFDYADVGTPPIHVNCRCYQRPEDVGSLE
jgi:HK97 family phage portal protein